MQLSLSKENIVRRILHIHTLARREAVDAMASTIGIVGIPTPQRESLGIAMAARIDGPVRDGLGSLTEGDRLLSTVSVRGAVRTMLAGDWPIFNRSLVPRDEKELLAMIGGARELLLPMDRNALHWLDVVTKLLPKVCTGSAMTKGQLAIALESEVAQSLSPAMREVFAWPSTQFKGQTFGESLMRYLLPVAALSVPVRLHLEPKVQGFLYQSATGISVGTGVGASDLIKRYLHAYGPVDAEDFAGWAGISPEHGMRLWSQLPQSEIVAVSVEGRQAWMLVSDMDRWDSVEEPEGIRLIGPADPLLKMPQRSFLIHGKTQYRYFFRSAGSPGMVLADGACVAGWHLKNHANGSILVVEDIGETLGRIALDELEREGQRLAMALGVQYEGVSITRPA